MSDTSGAEVPRLEDGTVDTEKVFKSAWGLDENEDPDPDPESDPAVVPPAATPEVPAESSEWQAVIDGYKELGFKSAQEVVDAIHGNQIESGVADYLAGLVDEGEMSETVAEALKPVLVGAVKLQQQQQRGQVTDAQKSIRDKAASDPHLRLLGDNAVALIEQAAKGGDPQKAADAIKSAVALAVQKTETERKAPKPRLMDGGAPPPTPGDESDDDDGGTLGQILGIFKRRR